MKIGIVGNGGIVQAALASMKDAGIEVTALWCRNAERGKPLTESFGIPSLYTDYAEFLKDESFDTVYVGLINSLHYDYTKEALLRGKNAIVEKPFTSTFQEAKELVEIAEEKNLWLFEAIMSRYSANYELIREHLHEIGDVKMVRSDYCQYSRRYDSYLEGIVLPAFDPKLSGGALYDINVYNVHFLTGLFGAPKNVQYLANTGFNGIDTSGVLSMDYANFKAVCTGAKDCAGINGSTILGTKGYIHIPNRPGFIKDVTLHLNADQSEKIIDAAEKSNPMQTEFEVMRSVMDAGDHAKADRWMQASLSTMKILEKARTDIGLRFEADCRE